MPNGDNPQSRRVRKQFKVDFLFLKYNQFPSLHLLLLNLGFISEIKMMIGKEKEKKMVSGGGGGVVWNFAAAIELKLLLITLLFFCFLVLTLLFQFIPFHLFLSSHSDFFPSLCQYSSNNSNPSSKPSSIHGVESKTHTENQIFINGGGEEKGIKIIKRSFNPYGSAAYSFIHMSTYRAGLNSFAIIGLSSKPFHLYSKPHYLCQWKPNSNSSSNSSITVEPSKILPDWGYGRVYTVVVLNCTFPNPLGVDGSGGGLILHSSTINGGDVNSMMKVEVLREVPGSFNGLVFTSPPVYDYLYCGSPLYGDLSPQRVREWIAYHVKLFGEKSHFVIYDAGGVHKGVLEVLKPWIEKGFVEIQEIRDQERFDGYYHNQFLVVNDCLHRYKFMAKWMFFFDIDEYIYVTLKNSVASVLDSLSDYTHFTFEQLPMSNKLCLSADAGKTSRKWGFEKLVYRDVKRVKRRDRKYAVQPRNVFAAGVHLSQNVAGKSLKSEPRIKYFHYHGTIAERREPCQQLVNATKLTFKETPYVLDKTLRAVASSVKRFEHRMIGSRLQRTHQ